MPTSANPSRCWLRCRNCGAREWVQSLTKFGPCPHCGAGPRYAEGDDGEPMIVWSAAQDVTSWGPDPTAGSMEIES